MHAGALSVPTLLMVDDDVGFVHAAAEIAREAGFAITVAGTAERARARLSMQPFDLVLLDLGLPDADGLDLLDQIDTNATRVVLVTARPTAETASRARRLPAADYLVKPIHASRFRELLDTARERRLPSADDGGAIAAQKAAPPAETADTITFAVGTPMHEIERRMLLKTLAYFDNNKARAAAALGITTKTIYNRLHAYEAQAKQAPRDDA